ncbi:hypothetical protein SLS57_011211 [Botryosphaeria dothidea]
MRLLARERYGASTGSLTHSDELLLLFNQRCASATRTAPSDYKPAQDILRATREKAQEMGEDHEFLPAELLRNFSAKYDPNGVFQRIRAGGLKLDRAYGEYSRLEL